MSTVYINGTTAAATGADFVLAAGSSRTILASSDDNSLGIPPDTFLTLQIKETQNNGYINIGTICDNVNPVGVVTARGAGDSTFRILKSTSSIAVEVLYD
tara:strand:+ start:104 stop:403 length:300 start_codon:yes stop_codon:yes gene_type:complete